MNLLLPSLLSFILCSNASAVISTKEVLPIGSLSQDGSLQAIQQVLDDKCSVSGCQMNGQMTLGSTLTVNGPANFNGFTTFSSTATNVNGLIGGDANEVVYQLSKGSTTFTNQPGANVVLFANSGAPSWTNTPTLTGSNLTGVPWSGLTSFPSACGSQSFETGVGASLSCSNTSSDIAMRYLTASSGTFATPLSISNGGTGSSTATTARSNILATAANIGPAFVGYPGNPISNLLGPPGDATNNPSILISSDGTCQYWGESGNNYQTYYHTSTDASCVSWTSGVLASTLSAFGTIFSTTPGVYDMVASTTNSSGVEGYQPYLWQSTGPTGAWNLVNGGNPLFKASGNPSDITAVNLNADVMIVGATWYLFTESYSTSGLSSGQGNILVTSTVFSSNMNFNINASTGSSIIQGPRDTQWAQGPHPIYVPDRNAVILVVGTARQAGSWSGLSTYYASLNSNLSSSSSWTLGAGIFGADNSASSINSWVDPNIYFSTSSHDFNGIMTYNVGNPGTGYIATTQLTLDQFYDAVANNSTTASSATALTGNIKASQINNGNFQAGTYSFPSGGGALSVGEAFSSGVTNLQVLQNISVDSGTNSGSHLEIINDGLSPRIASPSSMPLALTITGLSSSIVIDSAGAVTLLDSTTVTGTFQASSAVLTATGISQYDLTTSSGIKMSNGLFTASASTATFAMLSQKNQISCANGLTTDANGNINGCAASAGSTSGDNTWTGINTFTNKITGSAFFASSATAINAIGGGSNITYGGIGTWNTTCFKGSTLTFTTDGNQTYLSAFFYISETAAADYGSMRLFIDSGQQTFVFGQQFEMPASSPGLVIYSGILPFTLSSGSHTFCINAANGGAGTTTVYSAGGYGSDIGIPGYRVMNFP